MYFMDVGYPKAIMDGLGNLIRGIKDFTKDIRSPKGCW